jgi:serine/threonine protein kinase
MAVDLNTFDAQVIVANCAGLVVNTANQPLGRGGQKAVWSCEYYGAVYVLKVMVGEPETTERAKRELEIMRNCQSPHLAKLGPLPLTVLDLGNNDIVLYFLEELIAGSALNAIVKPFNSAEIKRLGLDVAAAVKLLWSNGYIHRDIKPHNIMRRAGSTEHVLLDAGIALDFAAVSITQTGNVVGTRAYLSPEQWQLPKRDLDFRADMFALGITMYECGTGKHPFWNPAVPAVDVAMNVLNVRAPHPHQFNGALNGELCDVILRLLEKPRHLRYARVEHLEDDLNRILI